MAIDYCAAEVGDHDLVECQAYLPGGESIALVVLAGNNIADPSDATEINAGIAEGWVKVLQNISLEIPRGSDITVDNPVPCGEPIAVNRTTVINLIDANVTVNNVDFWNSLDGKNVAQIIGFDCDSDFVTNINPSGNISISAGFVLPVNNTEFQRFQVTASFKGKNAISKAAKPVGVTGL
jgi:hypothetical protein